MYFKQLEIIGFKSFAERTIIHLEPGITVIVGPNGSGKSNILDAVKWVLGEQRTRELRGSSMQDVIFNGSETRPSTGMAEVSVTFDNADSVLPVDFAEVQVTRRLFRSGESEYLINRTPCRLRDIQDIFLDTGIGVNAYSLIGQGKMDMILSQKPEDRRFIFEEAAGILKYKTRKRLALKRLESAEQNLLRLADIVSEVERQMRSLKRQVHAVMRYRELSEQLRQLEIRSAWLRFRSLVNNLESGRKQLVEAQNAFEQLSSEVSTLEARHEQLGLSKLELDRDLLQARERVHEIVTSMDSVENKISLLKQRIVFCDEQKQRLAEERSGLANRLEILKNQLEEATRVRETIGKEYDLARQAVLEKTHEQDSFLENLRVAETELETVRTKSLEHVNSRARIQAEHESTENRLKEIRSQLADLSEAQALLETRLQELNHAHEKLDEELSRKSSSLSEVNGSLEEKRREEHACIEQLREKRLQIQAIREQKSSLTARLNSLRELRASYEGFAVGVRAVMRAKAEKYEGMGGVIGPAGDLITTEKEYERAIEAGLGGNINNVIVSNAETAKHAVDFLKKHNAGRVTFLPLDIIRSSETEAFPLLMNREGVIAWALDVVRYSPELHPAVEYLLYNLLLVKDLDIALAIARAETRFPRLVTLDGELVTPAGAVTGGRVKHEGRGVLGRASEISQLEKDLQRVEAQLQRGELEEQTLVSKRNECLAEHQRLSEEQKALERAISELRPELARVIAEVDSLKQNLLENTRLKNTLVEQEQMLVEKNTVLAQRIGLFETDAESYEKQLTLVQENIHSIRRAVEECAATLSNLRVTEAGLAHRLDELNREIERYQREITELDQDDEKRRQTLGNLDEQKRNLENEISEQTETLVALEKVKEQAQEQVRVFENRRQELLDETDNLDRTLKDCRERLREVQQQFHQLELSVRSDEDRLQFVNERISSEYGIALGTLQEESVGTDEYDDETRDRMVSEICQRLQRMGDVNLTAIEEYEALEQRHSFLVSQCDDLRQAKETLLGVIARSDRRIREMFMQTFEKVAIYFNEYFRRLFNGGQARLYLLDEDDPLESGIEIEARPPGKKPTSISLLSGGESALTAIALLFSILKAKPTPFCILDEVDAPLDEANIGRFLDIIEEFTENTQFLIITHTKQTMARADVLYGVTMQERGVSQILSARLEEPETAGSAA